MNNDNQSKDFKWFLDNYYDLYEQYGSSFLAIKDQAVIGVYKSYTEGVKETAKNHELGSFIVQECDVSEAAYTSYVFSNLADFDSHFPNGIFIEPSKGIPIYDFRKLKEYCNKKGVAPSELTGEELSKFENGIV